MIEFTRLEVENAGPYRGIQQLEFSSQEGVWIVYGANGRGKTSLLNLFHYVLYGEIRGRTGSIPEEEWINEPALEAGEASGFRVTLEFLLNDGEEWEVTRSFDKTRSESTALLVSRDHNVLPSDAGREALAAIAPPELSSFFLFDAEDLRRYELLLDQHGEAVEELRSAIERILGIPYLHHAAATLGTVNTEATRAIAAHLKRDEATRAAGEALTEAQALKDQLSSELTREKMTLTDVRQKMTQIMEDLRRLERSERIVTRLESLRDQAEVAEHELSEARSSLQEANPKLWRAVLRPRMNERLDRIRDSMSTLQTAADEAAANSHLRRLLNEGGDGCPVCGQPLDPEDKEALRDSLADGAGGEEARQELRLLRSEEAILRRLVDSSNGPLIVDRERRFDAARVRVREIDDRIKELREELADAGVEEKEIHDKSHEHSQLLIQEDKLSERIRQLDEQIKEQEANIAKLRKKALSGPTELEPSIREMDSLSSDLRDLFRSTAEEYRERMRSEVEERATEIFLAISTEEEYTRLRINEGYGLTILGEGGKPIPHRSAGYEHLVALALLGALQSFSPNRGPVVIDTPFGRLDPENTRRVMAALPRIANQTLLLTFEGEFDREAALGALGGLLKEEFELRRVSARETEITKR